jgi:2-amino-4-hydroxy-6-hydroxymethyldihydropteridine diphosphokinase
MVFKMALRLKFIFVICSKIKHINGLINKDIMNVAFLGLGGNLGDRMGNIAKVPDALKHSRIEIVESSQIYETEAWGSVSEKKYLNQVIKIQTALSLTELFEETQEIERKLGRKRTAHQNADRTIDIDILFFNADVFSEKNIQVPHPRLHLRKFVLIPLAELDKDFIHPVLKKTISHLLNLCADTLHVKPYAAAT